MMSDKTWDALWKEMKQEAAHLPQHRVVSSILRGCELLQMRLDVDTGFPRPSKTAGTAAFQHSKVAMRWWEEGCGWLYMGSHNFSPAAWGKPLRSDQVSTGANTQHLWIANYELGVLRIEPPGAEMDKSFWKGLAQQLGFRPGPLYSESGQKPATQRRIGGLARHMRDQPSHAQETVARPTGALLEAPLPVMPSEGLLPGEPLREVVVGVAPSCQWLPGQERLGDGGDEDDCYESWKRRMASERVCADKEAGQYVLTLVQGVASSAPAVYR